MKSGVPVAVLAALAVGAAPGRAAESPAAVTIRAPGATTVITRADVDHWVRIARASAGGGTRKAAEHEAVPLLVGFAWLDGEARDQGIVLTDADVRAETDRQVRDTFTTKAALRRFLRQTHQTLADIRERVRAGLLSVRIADRAIAPAAATVTDAAVDAELAAAGRERTAETRDIRVLVTRTRAAGQAVRAALEAGGSWSAVARRYALDGRHGELLRRVARGELVPRLARAAFGVMRGRLHGPIRTRYGYYVFEVVRIRPGRIVPVARQRREIRARLVADAQEKALDDSVVAFSAKWRARTVCAPAFTWADGCGKHES